AERDRLREKESGTTSPAALTTAPESTAPVTNMPVAPPLPAPPRPVAKAAPKPVAPPPEVVAPAPAPKPTPTPEVTAGPLTYEAPPPASVFRPALPGRDGLRTTARASRRQPVLIAQSDPA